MGTREKEKTLDELWKTDKDLIEKTFYECCDPEKMAKAVQCGSEQAEGVQKSTKQIMDNMLEKGMTIRDALGIDDNMMEKLYNEGYRLYQAGRYKDAVQFFRMLAVFDTKQMRFSFGIASCFHMLKEYENAIKAYINCTIVDPKDPLPYYHAADCYEKTGAIPAAIVMLEVAIKYMGSNREYALLKNRAQTFLNGLRQG